LGIQFARRAGYDPRAALIVVDRLLPPAAGSALDELLDLHPPYAERRALIEAELAEPTH